MKNESETETIKNLNKFLENNHSIDNKAIFDLVHSCAKSKIIFTVGKGAHNCASFLSSIMDELGITHAHTLDASYELRSRFLLNKKEVDLYSIVEKAEMLLNKCKGGISNDSLILLLSLSLFEEYEYIIMEVDKEGFKNATRYIDPYAVLLTVNDDEIAQNLISTIPSTTREIIALSTRSRQQLQ